jgi:hypothetical protein
MQVVVDRGRNPDDRKAVRVQCVSTRLRSISADDDECVCLMVGARAERHQASCHQTGEAVADAERFPPLVPGRSDHGTDGGVHAWRVASACENRDSFHRKPRHVMQGPLAMHLPRVITRRSKMGAGCRLERAACDARRHAGDNPSFDHVGTSGVQATQKS